MTQRSDQVLQQLNMSAQALSAPTRRYLAFREIMDGPNPLKPDEIRTMAAKRECYKFMLAYIPEAEQKDKEATP